MKNTVMKDEQLYVMGRKDKLYKARRIQMDGETVLIVENPRKEFSRRICKPKHYTDEYYEQKEKELLNSQAKKN